MIMCLGFRKARAWRIMFFLLLLLLFFMQMIEIGDCRGFPGGGDDWSSSPSMGYFSRNFGKEEDGSEIDPLYGVEKRFVPEGPNPLHN